MWKLRWKLGSALAGEKIPYTIEGTIEGPEEFLFMDAGMRGNLRLRQ